MNISDFSLIPEVYTKNFIQPFLYTIKIVKEMLKEENMLGKFKDILDKNNYFPESIFYQFIGYPENVFLYNDIFKDAFEKMQTDLH